ncbi:MAG: hydantoinase B/oxoprolinase family protein [Caldilineaceae bacterium]|nr:hydantoinase B/oxoprolinase family protein [Caldilineaceae bacterium]
MNPITLELYRHRFTGVAEEMGITLRRTGYSPNIKERLDFSCAIFDAQGGMIAQAAHIPAHLGAMPASVHTILDKFSDWQPGDAVIVNDPFEGGNHLPDITMIAPVFTDEAGARPDFFVASRAHHADVGGMTPGSLPLSTEIYQEGIIIPPVKLVKAGALDEDILRLILRNVRTPDERRGDLAAQRAAGDVGARRLGELVARHGLTEVQAYARHLQDYSERLTRVAIREWPDGAYRFEDVIEMPPGEADATAPIRVTATIADDEITFDFAGSAPAIHGSLNAVIAITQSACYYAVRCLLGAEAAMNDGCFRPIHILAPTNSVVNAASPAAVAGGNVETSQRITDVALGALAQALPERIPAAGQGTMNNLTMGGLRPDGTSFAYYETIGGGMGAAPQGDGLSGAQVHMTNTLNTPVEALELAFPLRLIRYSLRHNSGGAGLHRGGDGIVREYELLTPTTVTMLSERRAVAPWGLAGGKGGATGRNQIISAQGDVEELPAKFSRRLQPGQRLRIATPGGGGWGTDEDEEAKDFQEPSR